MSKGEGSKILKIQACVLKVNICCDGCQKKVRKVLNKIDGVYTTTIDAEERKVTVTGDVDPAILIKKLAKAGKHAELCATKGGNQQNFANMLQKLQLDHAKAQQKENGKPQKGSGGGDGGKEQIKCRQQAPQKQHQQPPPPPPQQPQQQAKGFKDLMMLPNLRDLKLPFKKDDKKVKFDLPHKDEIDDASEYTDDFDDDFDDDDDDMFDEVDDLEDDIFDDPKKTKAINFQPKNGHSVTKDKKSSGGGGGGGGGGAGAGGGGKGGIVQLLNKAMGGSNANGGGGKNGGVGNQNQSNGRGGAGSGGSGGKKGHASQDSKNGGNNNHHNKGSHSHGNQANHGNPAHGGGGGHKSGGNLNVMGGGGFPLGGQPNMMGHLGSVQAAMGQMGGFPAGGAGGPAPGYFHGGAAVPPELMMAGAGANPYQQQYLQALMQQQQQQRMMMINGQDRPGFPVAPVPMGYGYGRPMYMPAALPPAAHHHGEPYTMFSDENPNSCSVM